MAHFDPTRRDFLRSSAVMTGAALAVQLGVPTSLRAQAVKRTAVDQVVLGKTGIKISRLGIGTGVNNGADNMAAGKEAFIKVIRHAYDNGITYFDCAQRYATFGVLGEAIKGLPREKLYIQSKIFPEDARDFTAAIDSQRRVFNTDYVDSLLIHCRENAAWTDQHKAMMDAYAQAKEKKWIRATGVSCHSLSALQSATRSDWCDIHLVRTNPQGMVMDDRSRSWNEQLSDRVPTQPVLDEIKQMHDKGRGVIGMKIFANGNLKDPAERERSVLAAMNNPNIDAIVIGVTTTQQIDENLKLINRCLAA